MYHCEICDYRTNRKDNYFRHESSNKHLHRVNELKPKNEEQCPIQSDTKEKVMCCYKCAEVYKTKKQLKIHEEKCTGIDSLTCQRCMTTFTHRENKSRHIKKNNCKPVSIFEYLKRKENPEENIAINTNHSTISHSTLHNNSHNTTNIYINNYAQERMDYITFDDFLNIIKCCNNTIIPKYVKLKHFNPLFPENHNIKYKNNFFFIKKNGEWNVINSNTLSQKLYNDNGTEVLNQSEMHDEEIKQNVQDENDYNDIKMQTNYVELEVKNKDKEIKRQIIDVVKTANV
jgi:hypothetical protein